MAANMPSPVGDSAALVGEGEPIDAMVGVGSGAAPFWSEMQYFILHLSGFLGEIAFTVVLSSAVDPSTSHSKIS